MERITFQSSDNVTIVGDYGAGEPDGRAVLFLHMMPATRESWKKIAEHLNEKGISTLAIEFRGHGESVHGPDGRLLDRQLFTDAQHQSKIHDVEAGVRALMVRGAVPTRICIVGASIGANLAISYAGTYEAIPAVVALSPGLDFRGILTEPAVTKMSRNQKLFIAASSDDDYSYKSAQRLAQLKDGTEIQLLDGGGHGSVLLEKVPGFFDYVANWITTNLK